MTTLLRPGQLVRIIGHPCLKDMGNLNVGDMARIVRPYTPSSTQRKHQCYTLSCSNRFFFEDEVNFVAIKDTEAGILLSKLYSKIVEGSHEENKETGTNKAKASGQI